jgi:diacylglycerol kinase family enzyme
VEPFHDNRVNLFRGNTLEPNDLPDAALVFGGDGSVHRVLGSLAYAPTPLLVVPLGTANDFARCLGIAHPKAALRAWRRFLDRGDNVCSIDLASVHPIGAPDSEAAHPVDSRTFAESDGRLAPPARPLAPVIMRQHLRHAQESAEQQRVIYFSGIAGLGLQSEISRRTSQMPAWLRRHGGRLLAALQGVAAYRAPMLSMFSYDAHDAELRVRAKMLLAGIGNASRCGSGMRMLPKAKLDDGQLDVCFLPAMPKAKAFAALSRIRSGRHLQMPEVAYFRARQVFLESTEPLAIYADGEYLCHTPAEISAAPRALRVIVP